VVGLHEDPTIGDCLPPQIHGVESSRLSSQDLPNSLL
jgi:hypothetical protein